MSSEDRAGQLHYLSLQEIGLRIGAGRCRGPLIGADDHVSSGR